MFFFLTQKRMSITQDWTFSMRFHCNVSVGYNTGCARIVREKPIQCFGGEESVLLWLCGNNKLHLIFCLLQVSTKQNPPR